MSTVTDEEIKVKISEFIAPYQAKIKVAKEDLKIVLFNNMDFFKKVSRTQLDNVILPLIEQCVLTDIFIKAWECAHGNMPKHIYNSTVTSKHWSVFPESAKKVFSDPKNSVSVKQGNPVHSKKCIEMTIQEVLDKGLPTQVIPYKDAHLGIRSGPEQGAPVQTPFLYAKLDTFEPHPKIAECVILSFLYNGGRTYKATLTKDDVKKILKSFS